MSDARADRLASSGPHQLVARAPARYLASTRARSLPRRWARRCRHRLHRARASAGALLVGLTVCHTQRKKADARARVRRLTGVRSRLLMTN